MADSENLHPFEWTYLVLGLSDASRVRAALAATVTSEPAPAADDPDEFLARLARHRGGAGQIVRRRR